MSFVVYECRKCGYISSKPCTCPICGSRLKYFDEFTAWCPHCKKAKQGLLNACYGCGEYLDDEDVRLHPY